MAGIKITELPLLTEAKNEDLLYIVDSDDNTSKQIRVSGIVNSSTWTPNITAVNGACNNPTITNAVYTKIGNIVNAYFHGAVELDFASFQFGYIQIDPPLPTSNFQPMGVGQLYSNDKQCNIAMAGASRIYFSSDIGVYTQGQFAFNFTYEIN